MRKNSLRIVAILLTIAFLISACGSGKKTDTQQTNSAAYGQTNPVTQPVVTEADSAEQESLLRDPEESKAENSGALSVLTEVSDGFSCEGDVYTITAAVTYTFSGVSGSGQIVVDAGEEKVEIIFNGVTLANALALKVAFSDVINNLASNEISKPLSAYQGKVLNNRLEEVEENYVDHDDVFAAAMFTVTDYNQSTGEVTLEYSSSAITNITYTSSTGEIVFTY